MFKHLFTIVASLLPAAALGAPLTTAFTYQGQLTDAGTPANAAYDFEFCLFGSVAGADLVSCHAPLETVQVRAGLFAVRLDFGAAAFIGDEQFLEIRVRPDASVAAFTPLVPRQAITAAPNALHALSVSADAVGSVQIANATITNADLAPNAINTTQLVNLAVTLTKLADNSVDSAKIVNGSVAGIDLANGAVGLTQINSAQVQARVSGNCGVGEYLRGVNADGSVACDSLPGAHRVTVVEDAPGLISGTAVSIAIGVDGLPIVAYRESAQGSLRVAKCGNSACSANNVLTEIAATGDTGKEPSIVIGSDGLPAIAYVDGSSDVRYVHCGNAACSSGNADVIIQSSADILAGLSMVIGSDGFPIFSYGDRGTFKQLKFARCTTVLCSTGSVSSFDLLNPANDVGIDTALTVASDGFPFVVFRDNSDESTDIIHCGSLDCLTGNTLTQNIQPDGLIKLDLAVVALPPPFGPLVAFRNPTGTGMFVVRCESANCLTAGNVITTVTHPAGHGMESLSLRLGVGALPIVAYYDASNASLGLLRCGDRDCSNGNTFTTVDQSFAQTGLPNAMAVGPDGLPVIAYAHNPDQALRVVKCASVSCQ